MVLLVLLLQSQDLLFQQSNLLALLTRLGLSILDVLAVEHFQTLHFLFLHRQHQLKVLQRAVLVNCLLKQLLLQVMLRELFLLQIQNLTV